MTSNRRTDLSGQLNFPQWRWASRDKCIAQGWHPNKLAISADDTEAVINCQRSGPDKDWSLNQKLLKDALNSEEAGRKQQAYVRLTDEHGNFVAQETVQNVARNIGNKLPNNNGERGYGPFWWLNANFQVVKCGDPFDVDL